MANEIQTPKGTISVTANGSARLIWNTNFSQKWNGQYNRAQKFIDSEVLRLSEPLTPLRTGMLVKSGVLGTEIGSGTVEWIAPYAKANYYSARQPGSETGPERGPFWFERAKSKYKRYWIEGARRFAGGG